jgi:glycosyltransferase involved in cell wall biosynthesis
MEISLVIPAFNEENYIGGTLEAVAKNAPGAFKEIIVVDNASTDKTGEVAARYPGVQVIREPRKGTNNARERGFRATTGDLVAFIDADTRIRKGWVDKIKRAFERDSNLACMTGPYWFYDLPKYQAVLLWLNWHFAIIGHILTSAMGVTGNMVLRRSVLEKMGGFDTSLTFHGDDVDTALRASKFGRVRFTFSIILDSSGRRYRSFGVLPTIGFYIANTVRTVFNISPTKESSDALHVR